MAKFLATVFVGILLVRSAAPAFAETALDNSNKILGNAAGEQTAYGAGLTKDFTGLIGTIIKGVLGFVGTMFLALTIYGGVLWMTASGREEQVENAKKIITAAVIGVAITMSAYTITFFVTARLRRVGEGPAAPAPAQRPEVCGQESDKVRGTCRPTAECTKLGGTATKNSTCGLDLKIMCCTK